MKMYVETDNRLIKDDNKSNEKNLHESKIEDKKTADLLESYGLSKNAQILKE